MHTTLHHETTADKTTCNRKRGMVTDICNNPCSRLGSFTCLGVRGYKTVVCCYSREVQTRSHFAHHDKDCQENQNDHLIAQSDHVTTHTGHVTGHKGDHKNGGFRKTKSGVSRIFLNRKKKKISKKLITVNNLIGAHIAKGTTHPTSCNIPVILLCWGVIHHPYPTFLFGDTVQRSSFFP